MQHQPCLLAAIAQEQALAVILTLGIYDMHERNTPGMGAVLARYNYLPNAKPPAVLEESRCFTYAEDLPEWFDRSKHYKGDLPCQPSPII